MRALSGPPGAKYGMQKMIVNTPKSTRRMLSRRLSRSKAIARTQTLHSGGRGIRRIDRLRGYRVREGNVARLDPFAPDNPQLSVVVMGEEVPEC
jgi:hypothetical protein